MAERTARALSDCAQTGEDDPGWDVSVSRGFGEGKADLRAWTAFPSPNPRETETSQPGSSSPVCAQSESARAVRSANAYPLSVNAMQEILI